MNDYLFAPECYEADDFLLRSYRPGDGPLITEAVNNSYDHLKRFMEWATPDQSEETSEKLARTFRGKYLLAEDFVIGVFSLDESKLLGGTGFHLRHGPLANRAAEIGMWIRGSYAHRGLGTTVLEAMLRWGFTEWPWERLVWLCNSKNFASARVAEKAGMRHEGELRGDRRREDGTRDDTLVFAILREEWQQREAEPGGS